MEKRRENGKRENGKNRGRAGNDEKSQVAPRATSRALSVPFSPASARFIHPLPIHQPTGKTKKSSAEERVNEVHGFRPWLFVCSYFFSAYSTS